MEVAKSSAASEKIRYFMALLSKISQKIITFADRVGKKT